MEYEKFKEQFVEDLKERLEAGGEKFSVDLNAVQKMNQNYEAVTVKPEDAIIGVNLNMTEIYERYDRGMSYDTLVSEVAEEADRALHDRPDFNLEALQDDELAQFSRIYEVDVRELLFVDFTEAGEEKRFAAKYSSFFKLLENLSDRDVEDVYWVMKRKVEGLL